MQYYLESVPFTCFNKEVLVILLVYSNQLQEHDHEEADTVLVIHAVDTAKLNPFSECVAYSPDTSAFLLLIQHH